MTEAIVTICVIAFGALIVWSAYTDVQDSNRCKSMQMVVVHYEHNSYCANVGDLK